MLPGPRITPVLLLLPLFQLAACGEETPAKTAAHSRDLLLPLVEKPGKDRSLFSEYKNDGPATWNKNFWGAALGFEQFTGIGWGTERAGVLVTPEHVVSAAHYGNGPRRGVHFHDKNGKFLGFRAIATNAEGKPLVVNLSNDVRVARLESPAPTGARIYPLPEPKSKALLIDWQDVPDNKRPILIATDWRNPRPKKDPSDPKERQRWRITRSVHPVLLHSVRGRIMMWSFGPGGAAEVDPSYHETINKGDSSHPLFWIGKSELVLASTFSGPGSGPNYGSPEVQADIQKAIQRLGGSRAYTLKFAPVP